MWPNESFAYVALSNILQSLQKRPTVFLTLANLRCSSNVNFKSDTQVFLRKGLRNINVEN